ncbi:DUF5665 domain-containing protein [Mechercharimyces sp. CAU 1602]|nr:DUF5665 domain-containing protein [Mechercharimyces sp. CAU 1602]
MKPNKMTEYPEWIRKTEKLTEETDQLNQHLHKLSLWMEQSRVQDLLFHYTDPKRVIWINLLAGLSRGLGLTIGTAIVISLLSILLSQLSDLPFLTDTISELKSIVDQSTP